MRVQVEDLAETLTGTVIDGLWCFEIGAWDLDAPFTVKTDDGEKVRVRCPWACDVTVL